MPERIADYYPSRYYGNRHSVTADFCTRRRCRILEAAASGGPGGKLLDVGSGDGAFLAAAQARGWKVIGLELAGSAPARPSLRVCASLEEAARFGPYRCISLWHVLEHLPDPAGHILQFHEMLEPDGVLLLAVPDFGGLQARLFGRHWFHFDVPRHYHHFTHAALAGLLEHSGFGIAQRWHQELEYDWFGWIQSPLNAIMREPNVVFDALRGKPRRVGRLRLATAIAGAAALAGPALFATILSGLTRRGGTLIVAARPKALASGCARQPKHGLPTSVRG